MSRSERVKKQPNGEAPDVTQMTSEDYYFDSYAHFGIHEEMLKDDIRTMTYRDALYMNKHLVKDKVVLDVGCGTSILCLFAIKAGAKHAIGIDCSNIIDLAKEIVEKNGFSDRITLIKGKVEEVELPKEFPKVDIIISEWMGYCLFYECMLKTVLYARDKWLAPNGIIMPDKATFHLSGIEDEQYKAEKINWWNCVYGFDMSPIRKMAIREPIVDVVGSDQIVTDSWLVKEINMYTIKLSELDFTASFKLNVKRKDYVHAFVAFFNIDFTHSHKTLRFSTSPHCRQTHWRQTVFYLDSGNDEKLVVEKGDVIEGEISIASNQRNKCDLDVKLKVKFDGEHSPMDKTFEYRMH